MINKSDLLADSRLKFGYASVGDVARPIGTEGRFSQHVGEPESAVCGGQHRVDFFFPFSYRERMDFVLSWWGFGLGRGGRWGSH